MAAGLLTPSGLLCPCSNFASADSSTGISIQYDVILVPRQERKNTHNKKKKLYTNWIRYKHPESRIICCIILIAIRVKVGWIQSCLYKAIEF